MLRTVVCGAWSASRRSALAADISGAGATFPYPIYAKWADAYKKETGIGLNYQSIGSGGGIKQIKAKTVIFGASDMPLKPEDLEKNGLVQWPAWSWAASCRSSMSRASGRRAGASTARRSPRSILGDITKWNDPAIVKLNPGAKLPDAAIAVVHRSDGSGTTFIFTDYLVKVSPDWKPKVGSDASVEWPVGLGGKGNEGVATTVAQHQARSAMSNMPMPCRTR